MIPLAIYVHTPFCPSKCGYCDFNSYAMDGEIKERTTLATIAEIEASPVYGVPAKTIFFGGGTPTFLETDQLVRLLEAVIRAHPPAPECEITSEANPGTVDAEKFAAMRKAGFNRVSLGAQSFDKTDLMTLGRVHAASEIGRAVKRAREAGFENLNLDLMFALPGQSMRAWELNLRRALDLGPDHLSLYCLTIEPNTAYYRLFQRGTLSQPGEDDQAEMYDRCARWMSQAGFDHYEISNYARPGKQCQHNLAYWRAEDYAAYGPGAVGCLPFGADRIRYVNFKHPLGYSERVERGLPLWCEEEILTPKIQASEALMLGLRLQEGVPASWLSPYSSALISFDTLGWFEPVPAGVLGLGTPKAASHRDHVRLSALGRHFHNEVTMALL